MSKLIVLLIAFLLGSIPFGLLVGRYLKGIDIRKYGSGNIGTTNAFRILGPKGGMMVLTGDILKGVVAVLLGRSYGGEVLAILAGLAAIAGHNWSIFLGFKGGRGVATGAGVILGLIPSVTLSLVVVWVVTLLLTRYVSLASIVAAVCTPLFMWIFTHSWAYLLFGFAAGAFVIYRHRPNIQRLRKGTEPRIGEGRTRLK
ncbi:MAG: glycerol-3-phosphate 1-O-acyltransferase PlsY [Firmicutes bacterium]|nr:glycerol-3-phosphate 1-O-acyltransferase PlsY [Bacillota bacterium]